ncbi:MAG: tyrosine--tRNA ligase [Gemmatimonadaceae bacterium]|jgi:tyrosyl-tRNA synthetase|nr:tyrosine--tRNA ligase [Gemmatimonadaceae bacterium]
MASSPTDFLAELAWRGLLFQQTDGAAAALAAGPVSGYCGFDPTADSLHVGNLVSLMGLVHLQRCGHRPVALVGGGTGLIGDPSGKATERQLKTVEEVQANVAAIRAQLGRVLDFDGATGARLVDNGDWLRSLDLITFLRDTGKHFTVNWMLQKDSVESRLASESGISFTEFSYMLLQAHDFAELHRRHGVTLQLGGSDQWGNITAGTTLVRKLHGAEVHGVTLPLLTNAAGQKFGKSEAGAVWLDAARTTPYAFYQYFLQGDDRDAGKLLRTFTLLDRATIEALEATIGENAAAREAQRTLAREVTTLIHGEAAARTAIELSTLLFQKGDPATLSDEALAALAREVPFASVTPAADGALDTLALFADAGLAESKGAARRLLQQGGLSVNGVKLGAGDTTIDRDRLLRGGHLLLRKGARDYGLVRVQG